MKGIRILPYVHVKQTKQDKINYPLVTISAMSVGGKIRTAFKEINAAGMEGYYADHDKAIYFVNGDGVPWTASYIQSKGDPIADLNENLAAEQKARVTYEYLIQLSDDPGVTKTLRWLREREIVHYQRFGETLDHIYNFYSKDRYYFMGGHSK